MKMDRVFPINLSYRASLNRSDMQGSQADTRISNTEFKGELSQTNL